MTSSPPSIALLIDADNADRDALVKVLADLARDGDIRIRRAYGNWFKAGLKAWDAQLTSHGIRAVQQSDPVKGKNATDLALVIDAVDLHHTVRPDVYAIVSSDSDYTPLAHYLRERGAKVLGFGRPTTAASFRAACTTFTPLLPAGNAKPKTEPVRPPTLSQLLTEVIRKNADKQGWTKVGVVANHMRQQHGQAAKDHGKATWTKVLESLPGFEFRDKGTTNVAVRSVLGKPSS